MEEEEVESELQNMIEDGLVIVKPPSKGVSKGLDQHTYHIPVFNFDENAVTNNFGFPECEKW